MKEEKTIGIVPVRCYHKYCKAKVRTAILFNHSNRDNLDYQLCFYCKKHFEQIRKLSISSKFVKMFEW
jgi:hypothetical protein